MKVANSSIGIGRACQKFNEKWFRSVLFIGFLILGVSQISGEHIFTTVPLSSSSGERESLDRGGGANQKSPYPPLSAYEAGAAHARGVMNSSRGYRNLPGG